METRYYSTPVGLLQAKFSDARTLHTLDYCDTQDSTVAQAVTTDDTLAQELDAFFSQQKETFSIPVDAVSAYSDATPLQRDVWKTLNSIPYGKTISYAELARRSGHPRAVRAVASAVGKNPVSIVNPCHRVVRSDGSLGHYALGTLGHAGDLVKQKLLAVEQR